MDIENKKDGNLDKREEWTRSPTRQTSVNFDAYLHEQARREGITLRDALEFGIKFLIADKDGIDYPVCKLQEKLQKIVAHRNALLQEVEALRDPAEKEDLQEEINKDIESVFGGL